MINKYYIINPFSKNGWKIGEVEIGEVKLRSKDQLQILI